jgi:hypothetical protein
MVIWLCICLYDFFFLNMYLLRRIQKINCLQPQKLILIHLIFCLFEEKEEEIKKYKTKWVVRVYFFHFIISFSNNFFLF